MRRLVGAGLGVVDQVVVSGTSALMAILIAREADVAQFGQFALVQALLIFYQGALRTIPGSWVLVELAAMETARARRYVAPALRGSLLLGLVVGALLALVAFAVGIRDQAVVLSCVALSVGATLATMIRLLLYRFGRVGTSVAVSVASTGLFLLTLLALGGWSPFAPMVGYALALLLVGLAAALPYVRGGQGVLEFVALGRGIHMLVVLNTVLANGRSVLFPWAAQGFVGLTAVAGVRGAQTIAAVPLQVPQGIQPFAQASIARAPTVSEERRGLRAWMALQVFLIGPMVVVAFVVPDSVGEALLGDTWRHARTALPWILLGAMFAQAAAGYEMVLRKRRRLRALLVVKGICLPLVLLLCLPLGEAWGAGGIALVILLDNFVVMVASGWLVSHRRKDS